MKITRSIPCKLPKNQIDITIRDICRSINYTDPTKEVARRTGIGIECSPDWVTLPEGIFSIDLCVVDEEVQLNMQADSANFESAPIIETADNLEQILSSFFGYDTRPYSSKVFCVGLSKTGTTSLTEALRILGLFTWQCSPWTIGASHFNSDVSDISLDLSSLKDYSAAADLPICGLFRELDKEFPGSKFILTTRPEEKWVDSAMHQLKGFCESQGEIGAIARWGYGTDTIDREVLLQRYREHNRQVLEYFKDRSDLLVLDMDEDNQWTKLCSFLNLPEPGCAYPYLNKRQSIIQ